MFYTTTINELLPTGTASSKVHHNVEKTILFDKLPAATANNLAFHLYTKSTT